MEIREKRKICDLCSILANALDEHNVPNLFFCFLSSVPICGWELRSGWSARMGSYAFSPPETDAELERLHLDPIMELQHCTDTIITVSDTVTTKRPKYRGDYLAQMAIGHCGPPDTTVDPRLGGRFLTDKVNIDLLRSWIQTCYQNDQKSCCSDAGITPDGLMMIDVDKSCVAGFHAHSEAGQHNRKEGAYVALSYCWGKSASLRTPVATLPKLRLRGSLNSLDVPLTIRDAMLLTKKLGFQYLWDDALCIVQDDPVSAQAQIKQMNLVYSQASLTIIAAAGEDSSAGLPGVRPGTRSNRQEIVYLPCGPMITVIDGPPNYGRLRQSRWMTWAWTMQERLLATRKLIFTETQVFFECRFGFFMEEMVLEGALRQEFTHDPISPSKEYNPIKKTYEPEDGYNFAQVNPNLLDRLQPEMLFRHYGPLVEAYTARKMSFRSDVLNAFSGILSAMAHHQCPSSQNGLDSFAA